MTGLWTQKYAEGVNAEDVPYEEEDSPPSSQLFPESDSPDGSLNTCISDSDATSDTEVEGMLPLLHISPGVMHICLDNHTHYFGPSCKSNFIFCSVVSRV